MLDNLYRHKYIEGFEGLYSLCENGKVYSHRRSKYLKNIKSKKDTSLYVGLYMDGKRVKRLYITKKLINNYFNINED